MSQPERDDDDESLERMFEAIRRGDRDGFDRILGKYRPLMGEIVSKKMSPRLRTVMEKDDVVQDVSLSAYRKMAEVNFVGMAGFIAWLKTLTTNRLIDLDRQHFKAVRRRTSVPSLNGTADGSDSLRLMDLVVGKGPGPSTALSKQEMAQRMNRALSSCRLEVRTLLAQAIIEDLSFNEIAVRQGKEPAAVRKAFYRALDECRLAFLRLPPPDQDADA